SAIIVQGLANDNVKGSLLNRLVKEVGLSLINGLALALLVMLFGFIIGQNSTESLAIAVSMMSVIVVAALVGTFVPIILDKRGIDPAIATGPFITTSNDILGIYLFFVLAGLIIGF
ncbi:MAG: magnesium transporter, partial [Flavobacteriaceae bacterium]|nr:magnesium transporter [Flavobacteriaceae bacterium]